MSLRSPLLADADGTGASSRTRRRCNRLATLLGLLAAYVLLGGLEAREKLVDDGGLVIRVHGIGPADHEDEVEGEVEALEPLAELGDALNGVRAVCMHVDATELVAGQAVKGRRSVNGR